MKNRGKWDMKAGSLQCHRGLPAASTSGEGRESKREVELRMKGGGEGVERWQGRIPAVKKGENSRRRQTADTEERNR